MRISLRLLLFLAIAILTTSIMSCSEKPPLPTVPGPEDQALLNKAAGYILIEGCYDREGFIAITIPGLERHVIRRREGREGFYAVAGPDKDGRIVYIENHMMEKRHLLKLTNLEGTIDITIFEQQGDAIWDSVVGHDIALSPIGGRVAFVGKHNIPDVGPPDAYQQTGIEYGPLEIWSVETKTSITTHVNAVDRGMDWFPDASMLAYTTLLPRGEVLRDPSNQEIGGGFNKWERIPSVMILDLRNGTSRFLHVGWSPVVSPDGKSVIVSDLNKQHTRVDVKTLHTQPISLPGDWMGAAISFVEKDLILYWGLPTAGSEPRFTTNNSPLVGAKSMGTLKVADIRTGHFKTVFSPIDPRAQVSFGKLSSHGVPY